ncbi:MAG: hypothetical protein WAX77_08315 [Methylococcaceae bacterium]
MNFKKSLLYAALLPLMSASLTAKAEITAFETMQGVTHEFHFDSQTDAANSLFSSQVFNVYPAITDVRRAIEITDSSNSQSFYIVRAASDTYVVEQLGSDDKPTFTTIQKQGGVQAELYHYLLSESYTYAKSGPLDKTTQDNVNTVINNVSLSKAGSIFSGNQFNKIGSLSNTDKADFANKLSDKFNSGTVSSDANIVSPIPKTAIDSAITANAHSTINNYFKNGVLQGNPASYIAQMAYYDQNLDLGGVLAGHFDKEADSPQNKSRLAVKARLSNYSFSNQDVQVYTVTPSYTHELGKAWAVLFDVPLSYVNRSNGGSTYNVSMGMGIRIPVARYDVLNWDLVPLARIGGANLDCLHSHDLKCADSSFIYSGGVQSNLGFALGKGYTLILQNQYTYQTINALAGLVSVSGQFAEISRSRLISVADGNVDVYRNGAQLLKETDYSLLGRKVSASLNFADTRFGSSYGSFIDSQQEYGFNVSLRGVTHSGIANDLKIGMNYTTAKNMSDAIAGTIGMTF